MELGAVGDVAALLESEAGSLRKSCEVAVQPLCDGILEISPEAVSRERAMQIMIGLTSALTHLHGLRIIHRDVKLASRLLKSWFQVGLRSGVGYAISKPFQAFRMAGRESRLLVLDMDLWVSGTAELM